MKKNHKRLHNPKKSSNFARNFSYNSTMKKILLSLFACCISFLSFAALTLNGVAYNIDTLSMYPAGPGATFYELRMLRQSDAKGRLDCWLLTVDTRNPYVHIEEVLGKGQIVGTERPSAMATRSTTDTKIFFAGTNGDFFVTQGDVGLPVGLTIVNSEFAHTPSAATSRRAGGVTDEGLGILATNIGYSFSLVTADDTLKIHHVNYQRNENELVLYNAHNAATTGTNAYGTELQAELLPGERWQTSGTMKLKITDKQQNVGSMPLAAGKVVLSGHGTMAAALDAINVGDEVAVNMSLLFDGKEVDVAQCIGGDTYALIVNNGQVEQSNFWNELHPRTAFGTSEDGHIQYFLVVDGRSNKSAGCTTKVLGEIMQHYGAHYAVNWDGGGSSGLYIRPFGPMNNGSDGSERACGNGMFAVANVPEVDNTITSIAPYQPIYSLPRYGVAAPKFLGYNQYGVLVDTNLVDVKLSCDPALGEILPDGRLLASGTEGGKLTATWGNITTELDVRIISSASVSIRLDTVLCDALHPYKVEVTGTVGNNKIEILAEALDWVSLDPAIATVNDLGEITGHSNGQTMVVGTLGDFADTLVVNVEVAEANKMVWDDFRAIDTWKVTGSPSSFKPVLSVPQDDNAPALLTFTYGSGRNKFVQLAKDSLLYSLPEKIQVPFTSDAVYDKVIVMIRANNTNTTNQITFLNPLVGEENVLEIDIKEVFGSDVAIYPLLFKALKFVPTTGTENGERYITLPGIIEVFGDEHTNTGLENTIAPSEYTKFLENGQLFIRHNGQIYTMFGTKR